MKQPPQWDYYCYGRGIGEFEDGDGFVVEGHDRRSFAALSSRVREFGDPFDASCLDVVFALFHTDCGCTLEEHERHVDGPPDCIQGVEAISAAGYEECVFYCDNYGLPPCSDRYGWMIENASMLLVAAQPVLRYSWGW